MHIALPMLFISTSIDILVFKIHLLLIAIGNNPGIHKETQDSKHGGAKHIRPKQSAETYPACQHGDNVTIQGQPRREKDDCDKDKEVIKKVIKPWNEIDIIIEDQLLGARIVLYEVVDFFSQIDNNCHEANES